MYWVAVLTLLLIAVPRKAAAYIDPSAGSLFLQLLLGGAAGILVIAKLYYRRIMTFLGRRRADADPARDEGGHNVQ